MPYMESLLDDHDVEIFAGNHERPGPRNIVVLEKLAQIPLERALARRVEGQERLVGWAVELAEHVDPVLRGAVPEVEYTPRDADVGRVRAEQRDDMRLVSPQHRRTEPSRRR